MTSEGRRLPLVEFGSRYLSLWPHLEVDHGPRAASVGLALSDPHDGKLMMQAMLKRASHYLSLAKAPGLCPGE